MSLLEVTTDPAPHPFLTIDYETARDLLFAPNPEGTPVPVPVVKARPARRLRDAMEPITYHPIWSRHTNEVLAKLGLKIFTGYVWGRAAALGEPPAEVVAAAFATFPPGLIIAAYEDARRQCGRAGMLAAREEATIESLAEVLDGTDVMPVVTVLRRGVEAADATGRPMFAGLRSLGWPEHPVGQLWRACDLLREHRGDGHIAACISAGLGPVAMNILTELWVGAPLGAQSIGFKGWSEEAVATTVADLEKQGLVADGGLTSAGRALRDDVEERTDAMEASVLDAIGDDFDATVAALDTWSAACIATGNCLPNIYKHATG